MCMMMYEEEEIWYDDFFFLMRTKSLFATGAALCVSHMKIFIIEEQMPKYIEWADIAVKAGIVFG